MRVINLGWLILCLSTGGCSSDKLDEQQGNADAVPLDSQQVEHGGSFSASEPSSIATASVLAEQSWSDQLALVQAGKSERIIIEQTAVTEAQLKQLPELSGSLTELLIDAGGVTDATIDSIASLPGLVHLRLRDCPISDQGLEKLAAAGLSELQILNIPHGTITSVGISQLSAFPKLVQLRLGGSQLDDQAVKAIAELPKLRSLHLIGPKLSDASLSELAKSPLLSTFYLDDCVLSDGAWENLFQAKPHLHVHVDQAHHDRDPNRHE